MSGELYEEDELTASGEAVVDSLALSEPPVTTASSVIPGSPAKPRTHKN